MIKNPTSLLYVFIPIIFSIVVLMASAQSSFSQEAESTDTIPELLIYDEETESAVLSPEKIHGIGSGSATDKLHIMVSKDGSYIHQKDFSSQSQFTEVDP